MSWNSDDGYLWSAVSQTVAQLAHLEHEWDAPKMEKKLRDYFSKGAKSLDFNRKGWEELINEYCDNAFSSVFCGLWDRPWINQANFLLCVDAGVKDYFPPRVLQSVSQEEFEQHLVLSADRAFDQQRFWTFRWETIQRVVTGKATQKKVREAVDAGRSDTVLPYLSQAEDEDPSDRAEEFVTAWITSTVQHLSKACGGDVGFTFSSDSCVELFDSMVQEGALPTQLTEEAGLPPKNWPVIDKVVKEAYDQYGGGAGGAPLASAASAPSALMSAKGKGGWGKGAAMMAAFGGGGWGKGAAMMSPYGGGFGKGGSLSGWGGDGFDWGGQEPAAKRFKGGW